MLKSKEIKIGREAEVRSVDGYDRGTYDEGGNLIELLGSNMPTLRIGMDVTLRRDGERKIFGYGGIHGGDRLKIVGLRDIDSDMVQISNGSESDWIRPSYVEEAVNRLANVDMRQIHSQSF